MKEMVIFYSKFNKKKDNEIIEILKNMPTEDLYKNRKICCGSIFNLFCHIIIGSWFHQANLKRIIGIDYKPYFPLNQTNSLDCSFEESTKYLQVIDDDFIDFCNKLQDDDFKKDLKSFYIKVYNRTVDETFYEIFTLCIVHQIHHRGQLSQIFNELEIKHSLGNVWPFIPDSMNI